MIPIYVGDCECYFDMVNFLVQHLHEIGSPIMEEILAEAEVMLARGKMDLPISLLFAASRGDDIMLNQLLKKGSDPNEPDKNGKTALVRKYDFL